MTATAVLDTSARVSCERCATVHRVRDVRVLKPGMRASCSVCDAPFFVVAMPESVLADVRGPEAYEDVEQSHRLPTGDEQEASHADSDRARDRVYRTRFHGTGGSLFGIHLVNALLTIVTFGLYYYWAKVRVRCYLFSQAEFAGDRFAYHGNARELIIGAVKAALVFGIP
ncbi:MAG: DUF898 family protein, partial [Gemmatimonadota bacterium]|nr:DUF898 family protein [Gemmatimonadota bacterium]